MANVNKVEPVVEEETCVVVAFNSNAPIKLGVTKAALTKLQAKYKEVPDATTKEGYQAIIEAKRELTPLRTGVEAERKLQVAAAVEHQRKVNAVANTIITAIKAIEEPLYAAKLAVDEAAAKAKREAEEAEERRILEVEARIDAINDMTNGLLNADLAKLEKQLSLVNKIVIDEERFFEFVEPAKLAMNNVIATLINACEARRKIDEQEAILAKQKEAMAAQQAEFDKKQREFEQQQQDHNDRVEAERLAREAEETKKRQAEEKAKQDKIDEEARIEAARLAEEAKKKTEAELAARLPEDQKLREYADALQSVIVPFIDDIPLMIIQSRAVEMVDDIVKFINENTQNVAQKENKAA